MTVHIQGIEGGYWMDIVCHSNPESAPRGVYISGPYSDLDIARQAATEHDLQKHEGNGDVVIYRYRHYNQLEEARQAHAQNSPLPE